jgi:hypothetical protein
LTMCFMDRCFLEFRRWGRTCWSSLGPSLGRSLGRSAARNCFPTILLLHYLLVLALLLYMNITHPSFLSLTTASRYWLFYGVLCFW